MKTTVEIKSVPSDAKKFTMTEIKQNPGLYKPADTNSDSVYSRILTFTKWGNFAALYVNVQKGYTEALNEGAWIGREFILVDEEITLTFKN